MIDPVRTLLYELFIEPILQLWLRVWDFLLPEPTTPQKGLIGIALQAPVPSLASCRSAELNWAPIKITKPVQ